MSMTTALKGKAANIQPCEMRRVGNFVILARL